MGIKQRLEKLEQKQPSASKRYYVATPDLHDDTILHIKETGQSESMAMSLDEYAQWLTTQEYNVVYRLAYPD